MNDSSPLESLAKTAMRCTAIAAVVSSAFWILRIVEFRYLHAKLGHTQTLQPARWSDVIPVTFWVCTVLWFVGGVRLLARPTPRPRLLRAAAWLWLLLHPVSAGFALSWMKAGSSPLEMLGEFLSRLTEMLDWLLLSIFVLWGLTNVIPVATPEKLVKWIGGGAVMCGAYVLYARARPLPQSLMGLGYQLLKPSWLVMNDVAVVVLTAAGVCWALGGIGLLRGGSRRSSALVSIACGLSLVGMACDTTEMTMDMFRLHEPWFVKVAEVMSSIQWTMFGFTFAAFAVPLLAHFAVRSSIASAAAAAGRGFTPVLKVQDSAGPSARVTLV